MYDLNFIFEDCGFSDIPEYIKRERLFNVSFDINTGAIKLYVLDDEKRSVYKVSHAGISRQYAGDAPEFNAKPAEISRFLGKKINFSEIILDAVEEDACYLYLDDARVSQQLLLVGSLCERYRITPGDFLQTLCMLNNMRFYSIQDALRRHALSLVKVPLRGLNPKLYARPLLSGHPYILNAKSRLFLRRLYNCSSEQLLPKLTHMWVSRELHSSRTLIVTQHHALLHRD